MNPPNYSLDADPPPPPPPPKHRRALSDTSFRFSAGAADDDDFLFDIDTFNLSALDIPMAADSSRSDESSGGDNRSSSTSSRTHHNDQQVGHHLRSLSVDADFFEGLSFGGERKEGAVGGGERSKVGSHRRTSSMDGLSSSCSSMMFEGESYSSVMDGGVKKAMPPERLAELALIDPKRAKRILANRQSAARSKERKIRYTSELERKVQTLQTEATTLSAQITMLQRDTSGLSTENKELKLRLQALKQQAELRDALNEALRQEVQRLRIATGQVPSGNSNASSMGFPPHFPTHPRNSSSFSGQQNHQQPQQSSFQMPTQPSAGNQNVHQQLKPGFLDFNHRV